jgi:hypothetical protein
VVVAQPVVERLAHLGEIHLPFERRLELLVDRIVQHLEPPEVDPEDRRVPRLGVQPRGVVDLVGREVDPPRPQEQDRAQEERLRRARRLLEQLVRAVARGAAVLRDLGGDRPEREDEELVRPLEVAPEHREQPLHLLVARVLEDVGQVDVGPHEEDVRGERVVVHRRLELLARGVLLPFQVAGDRGHEERLGALHVRRLGDRDAEERRGMNAGAPARRRAP